VTNQITGKKLVGRGLRPFCTLC